jgi:hypothetical protein
MEFDLDLETVLSAIAKEELETRESGSRGPHNEATRPERS